MTAMEIVEVFGLGVDYGLLLAEQERESEAAWDAMSCWRGALKTSMPTIPRQGRAPHSEKWKQAKAESLKKFMELVKEANQNG